MAETEDREHNPAQEDKVAPQKKAGGLNRVFFGSLPRSFMTIIVFFGAALVALAYVAPKHPIIKKASSMQSTKAVQEVNGYDAEKIKRLEAENAAYKAKIASETTSTPTNLQQPIPPLPNAGGAAGLQSPPFAVNNTTPTNPGHLAAGGPMGAISRGIGVGASSLVVANKPEYAPMQKVSIDQRALAFPQNQPAATASLATQSATDTKSCPGASGCTQKNLLGGARAMGTLFNGVSAVEGLPYPVVIDIKTMTKGPNNTSVAIRDCSVLAAGTANISSGRLMIQPKELNCYIGGEYITEAVDGYVVDLGDQRIGLKGTVEENNGKYIAELILSSVAGGFAAGVAQSNVTTAFSAQTGAGSSIVTGNALQYGAGQGISNAAQQYAKKVASEADKILPYVDVAPEDKVLVVFTKAVHISDGSGTMSVSREVSSWVK